MRGAYGLLVAAITCWYFWDSWNCLVGHIETTRLQMAKLENDTSVQCSSFYFVLPATYSHCIIASKLCLMGCMLMFLKDNLLADINNILKDWNAFQIWPNWNSLIRRLTPLHRLWLRDYYMLRVQCIINKAKITLSTENKYNCNSLWKTLEVIGRKEPLQHASKYDDDDEMMMLALQIYLNCNMVWQTCSLIFTQTSQKQSIVKWSQQNFSNLYYKYYWL